MEGLYVDARHRLVIVQAGSADAATGARAWPVHTVGDAGESRAAVVRERLDLDDRRAPVRKVPVRLCAPGAAAAGEEGVFDAPAACVAWAGGDEWHLLLISDAQAHLMTRRPYVPLTLLLWVIAQRAAAWLAQQWRARRARVAAA